MRVLLTNYALDERAGTEMYVRDVALALLRRGHEPIVYSRRLGEVALELRRATIPVLDDLDELRRPPDVIHGHHHLETMTALARFPETPAVYLCHGWLPEQEAPPRHPRILRYIAVDDLVQQRLLDECGIPEERVETHLNFVDLERFRQRPPLPAEPKRALVFSNLVSENNGLPALRQACNDLGMDFEAIGRSVGNPKEKPEDWLGDYDLVFAKGRAALEACATGCAVVLCDRSGLGGLVTTKTLDRSRRFNFGVRLLRRPVTLEAIRREIERYTAEDASEVTHALRQQVGLEPAVDRLVSLYDRVVDNYSDSPSTTDDGAAEEDSATEEAAEEAAENEARAMARYLRWGPLTAGDFFQPERERLQGEIDHAKTWAYELHDHLQKAFDERKTLENHLLHAKSEQQRLVSALATAEQKAQNAVEQGRLNQETAEANLAAIQQDLQTANDETAQRQARIDELADWIVTLEQRQDAYIERIDQQGAEIEQLTRKNAELETELTWIRKSFTWRWRERLSKWRWLTATYRILFTRGARP